MSNSQTDLSQSQQPPTDLLGAGASLGAPLVGESGSLVQVNDGNSTLHLAFADFHASYVGQYIQLADAKAGVTFAVAAGLLGYLLDKGAFGVVSKPAFDAHFILATITAISLIGSGALSFIVVAPRLRKSPQDGFVFWGAVAQIPTGGDFVEKVTTATPAGMVQARLTHCYDLSRVCAKKYAALKLSMFSGAVGVAAAIWFILLT